MKRNLIWLAAVVAIVLAAFSTERGSYYAIHRSQDFRWSPTVLLLQHIDPWQDVIQGDPRHAILMTQVPNDLPMLYVLIFPLGLLSFGWAKVVWLGCNLVFTLLIIYFGSRIFRLSKLETFFAGTLFLMSTSWRVCLGNGQQAILTVLFLTLAFYAGSRECPVHPFWTGLGFFKYNFAPPLWLYGVLRCGWRWAVYSLLPCVVGLVVVTLWLHGNLFHIAREPLAVAKLTLADDPTWDLMGALQVLLRPFLAMSVRAQISQALGMLLCVGTIWLIGRRGSGLNLTGQAALVSYTGPLLITHNTYDLLLLVLPFFFLVKHRTRGWAKVALAVIAYIWFLARVLSPWMFRPYAFPIGPFLRALALFSFCTLALGFVALWKTAAQVSAEELGATDSVPGMRV